MEKLPTAKNASEHTITIIPLSDVNQALSADEEQTEEKPISEFGVWEEWHNDDGISYFYNKETGESTWEDPRMGTGAAAANAILQSDSPNVEVQQESKQEEPKVREKRCLVRDESVHKWELNDIENMKNDMLAQMAKLQNETQAKGERLPTLRKKYRPIRSPPIEPPTKGRKWQKAEVRDSHRQRPSHSWSVSREKPTTLPPEPIPLPDLPKSLPPSSPLTAPTDFPPSLNNRDYSPGSISMDEMWRSKSTGEVVKRGRAKKRSSTRSVQSEYLTAGAMFNVYVAVSSWTPDDNTKLELKEGDKITVQKKKSSGWWLGKNQSSNKSGYFPASYVMKVEHEIRRSKSQEVNNRNPRMWSGKMMHDRSRRSHRNSARTRRSTVARKSSQLSKRRNTRMGE